MSRSRKTDSESASGCHWVVVTLVMPMMTVVVAVGALIHGAMLTIDCERAGQDGHVDVRVTQKILGLLPIQRVHLEDVIDADSTSSSNRVTDARGRTTSTYSSGRLDLTTRGGRKWSSPEISHAVGHPAGEMEQKIQEVLDSAEPQRTNVWSMSWLSNLIGVAFTLVALLFVWRWIARLLGRGARSAPA